MNNELETQFKEKILLKSKNKCDYIFIDFYLKDLRISRIKFKQTAIKDDLNKIYVIKGENTNIVELYYVFVYKDENEEIKIAFDKYKIGGEMMEEKKETQEQEELKPNPLENVVSLPADDTNTKEEQEKEEKLYKVSSFGGITIFTEIDEGSWD